MNDNLHIYQVQVGKDTRSSRGRYKTRYEFTSSDFHHSRAWLYYASLNVHSGYKKRLVRDGKVIAKQLTSPLH